MRKRKERPDHGDIPDPPRTFYHATPRRLSPENLIAPDCTSNDGNRRGLFEFIYPG